MLAAVGPFSQKTQPFLETGSLSLGPLLLMPNRLVAAAVGAGPDRRAAVFSEPHVAGQGAAGGEHGQAGGSGGRGKPPHHEHPGLRHRHHAGRHVGRGSDPDLYLGALGGRDRGDSLVTSSSFWAAWAPIRGALFGGLIIGLVEALGAGCYPDPSKGAAYKTVFGLVIFAVMLLVRPTACSGGKNEAPPGSPLAG